MDQFYRTHDYLLEHMPPTVGRDLMAEIDWNDRLIGIKGARGVGKTTFLLQYAKTRRGLGDRSCLYINTNNFYVQNQGFAAFAGEFYAQGGKVLLIDQVYKQPDWNRQLRECHDRYTGLKIVFTGSSVMNLDEDPYLRGAVKTYNLRGFSFREYLNLMTGSSFRPYTLQDILQGHADIARDILSAAQPRSHFADYLHHGFYPFFLEKRNYQENLLKTMNMMIEVDILLVKQIELKYLPKIKSLFFLLTTGGGSGLNVSQLSAELGISRSTVMHYIKYLSEARLVNILYGAGEEFPKKPAKVMLHNTNLMYSFYPKCFDELDVLETFFCNTMWKDHKVNKGTSAGTYLADGQTTFRIAEHLSKSRNQPGTVYAVNHADIGSGSQIPLWLLGFLY